MKARFFLATALGFLCFTARAGDIYRSYQNARFGTLVRYPTSLVAPQPESENGDGRRFVSRDGRVEFLVFARHNVLNRSLRAEMRADSAGWKARRARLTYAKSGTTYFTLSGFIGRDIFYQKTLLRGDDFHTLCWRYPQALKKRLDAAVTRSAATLSVVRSVPDAAPAPVFVPRPLPQSRPRPTPRPTPRAPLPGY